MFSFGQQQQQQQQNNNQGLLNNNNNTNNTISINAYTRQSDLPQPMQNELEAIDSYINKQMSTSDSLTQTHQEHNQLCESIPVDVEVISTKLQTTIQALNRDLSLAKLQKDTQIDKDESVTRLSIQMLDQLRTPGSRMIPSDPLLSFFSHLLVEFHESIVAYSQKLCDIEQAVEGQSQHEQSTERSADELLSGLKTEYHVFMGMASRVAELHHAVEHIDV